MATLKLEVNGNEHEGWLGINVSTSMQRSSGAFNLRISQTYAGNPKAIRVKAGQACRVLIDKHPIITGYIDAAPPNYDAENCVLTVSGRDRTADLIDCSAPPTQFLGQTLLSLSRLLCKPFGIEVVDQAGEAGKFRNNYKSNDGDSVFEVIELAARSRGVLPISDGEGRLVLARTGKDRAKDSLVLGKNILSGSGGADFRELFSRYTMKSQHSADVFGESATAGMASGFAIEDQITRYRPIRLLADCPLTPKECSDRARWERDIRRGRANAITYRVRGWLQSDDTPWRHNLIVHVKDDYQEFDGDKLITDVNYTVDDKGEVAELTVMDPSAFALLRGPDPKDKHERF